ncbi:F-box LRR-repeat 4 [Brachionus plicatilis]|uniref:F-box LRR-repeat 4 n=1 Tax=Brachionus plicatilis TaxID=10195 RepID=A0A3M7Q2S5_BRAPC|nr:F-box LRR-repeat 4 [Brachionus plicatilis]
MQASKPENLIVRQFVKSVLDFSSQYGREQSGSYTVANVRGCPTNYPKYGDFLESCVLRTYGNWWNEMSYLPDIKPNIAEPFYISKDFIELEFEQKLMIDSVIIYENYNPGAVVALYAFDYIKNKWTLIWSIFDDLKIKSNSMAFERPLPKKESRKFRPDLTKRDIFSNLVRIEFEHGKLDYYTELDAIEIVGYPFDLKLSKEIAKNIRHIGDKFFSLEISSDHLENASDKIKNESVRSEKKQLTITELPNELLQKIIRLLDLRDIFFLRSTCRKFYQLCSERDLFNQLDLKPFWNQVNEALLETFYNLSCEFKALDVSWSKLESTQIFKREIF